MESTNQRVTCAGISLGVIMTMIQTTGKIMRLIGNIMDKIKERDMEKFKEIILNSIEQKNSWGKNELKAMIETTWNTMKSIIGEEG